MMYARLAVMLVLFGVWAVIAGFVVGKFFEAMVG